MALTSRGLPYPVGTDLVIDGDNVIRSLAESLDQDPVELEALRSSTSLNVATASWLKLQWSFPGFDHRSDGLGFGPSGVTAVKAGRYYCEAAVQWPSNATGRRIIGVSTSAASQPGTFLRSDAYNTGANSFVQRVAVSASFNAGDVITAFLFQDSGTTLTVDASNTQLIVRRLAGGQKHA